MRWTSTGSEVARRTASVTSGPIVICGTKCPSITSTWIQSAPACSASTTCSRSRPKSADRIEGASLTLLIVGSRASALDDLDSTRTRHDHGRGHAEEQPALHHARAAPEPVLHRAGVLHPLREAAV